jgi:hypothetical protein
MTLPLSGPLKISEINAEFNRGTNLTSYQGTVWYTDGGSSGNFSSTNLNYGQFYGKRPDAPYRYGTGSGIYSPQAPPTTKGAVFAYINGGQPFAAYEIYVISTTSGQPTGLVLSGNLDSNGELATVRLVESGQPGGEYWFPVPQTNTFQLYQAGPGGGLVALNTWSVSSRL